MKKHSLSNNYQGWKPQKNTMLSRHISSPKVHTLSSEGDMQMDYTVRAIRCHLVGVWPITGVLAAFFGLLTRFGQGATIWQLNRMAFWLMTCWWVLTIFLVRLNPPMWSAKQPRAARHATRVLWGGFSAMLTSSLVMVAAHYTYSGIWGHSSQVADLLLACGSVLWGQAAGCKSLAVYSRPKAYLYLAIIGWLLLAVLSFYQPL